MRMTAYAGASTALAAAVVLNAFNQRPNFYSACVYLASSSACRMILFNLLILSAYGFMRFLQKLLYGPLRPIEREQLWDRSWYAITETALAMTTFRDEVGAWFFVMFISLLAGKVWGWISEGRVELLEQQPPTNPRLFHARLATSLFISLLFDILMLRYCITTLLEQPRPGMMVMFAFEFAVLGITSTSTSVRYILTIRESLIIKQQTAAKLKERREEIRAARQLAEQSDNAGESELESTTRLREEDVDENDIDVPGWQEKGRWILFLDLLTDFSKLVVYLAFFVILLVFHGLPIHIIRDVYLTMRSFVKRITDFIKYRNATRDMHARYPDATAEELERDGTCIICREEMRPWQQQDNPAEREAGAVRPPGLFADERHRAKKLPCGHILHFSCLRSWLERQQVCPTCRSSVLAPPSASPNVAQRNGAANIGAGEQPNVNVQGQQPHRRPEQRQQQPGRNNPMRARTFNLGNWRLTFAAGNQVQVQDALQRMRGEAGALQQAVNAGADEPVNRPQLDNVDTTSIETSLEAIQHRIAQQAERLNVADAQLTNLRAMQAEASRLTALQASISGGRSSQILLPSLAQIATHHQQVQGSEQHVFTSDPETRPLSAGDANLPESLTLPDGWTMLPLRRLEGSGGPGLGHSGGIWMPALPPQFVPPNFGIPTPTEAEAQINGSRSQQRSNYGTDGLSAVTNGPPLHPDWPSSNLGNLTPTTTQARSNPAQSQQTLNNNGNELSAVTNGPSSLPDWSSSNTNGSTRHNYIDDRATTTSVDAGTSSNGFTPNHRGVLDRRAESTTPHETDVSAASGPNVPKSATVESDDEVDDRSGVE